MLWGKAANRLNRLVCKEWLMCEFESVLHPVSFSWQTNHELTWLSLIHFLSWNFCTLFKQIWTPCRVNHCQSCINSQYLLNRTLPFYQRISRTFSQGKVNSDTVDSRPADYYRVLFYHPICKQNLSKTFRRSGELILDKLRRIQSVVEAMYKKSSCQSKGCTEALLLP